MACGFSGHGFKFAPVVGEILADLATTGRTPWDISLFDPLRFAELLRPGHGRPPRRPSERSRGSGRDRAGLMGAGWVAGGPPVHSGPSSGMNEEAPGGAGGFFILLLLFVRA